jgi:hypothetical protein
MEIIKNMQSLDKARNIIHSCETYKQLDTAQRFCELYYEMFEDRVNYERLLRDITIRRAELTFE